MRSRVNYATRMTLIELLATVAILAALAGAAIAGLGDLAGRTRQTGTLATGGAIRKDIVGSNGGYSPFLSDLGRLPVVLNNNAGTGLGELFSLATVPATLLYNDALGFINAYDDGLGNTIAGWGDTAEDLYAASLKTMTISLPCGWRGPYYVTPSNELYDGWGNEWQVNIGTNAAETWVAATDVAALSKPFCAIRSTGRDGIETAPATASWEDADKVYAFDDNLTTAELTVEVYVAVAGVFVAADSSVMNRIQVAVYAPYATDSALLIKRVLSTNIGGAYNTAVFPVATAGFSHTESGTWDAYNIVRLTGLRPGVRRLYAFGYYWNGSAASNGKTSGVQVIEVKPGGNVVKVYLSQDLNS